MTRTARSIGKAASRSIGVAGFCCITLVYHIRGYCGCTNPRNRIGFPSCIGGNTTSMDTLRNEISAVTAVALIAGICRIVRRPILVCVVAGGNAVIAVVVIDLGCNPSGGKPSCSEQQPAHLLHHFGKYHHTTAARTR